CLTQNKTHLGVHPLLRFIHLTFQQPLSLTSKWNDTAEGVSLRFSVRICRSAMITFHSTRTLANCAAQTFRQREPVLLQIQRSPSIHARSFFDSLITSALGPCPLRSLTHTKHLPYSSNVIFKAVSDVSGYPTFLPFTISSNVTSRDSAG